MSVVTLPVPAPPKEAVEHAVGVVARHGEVRVAGVHDGITDDHDAIVRLDGDRERPVALAEEVRGGLALRAEVGIDRAVR